MSFLMVSIVSTTSVGSPGPFEINTPSGLSLMISSAVVFQGTFITSATVNIADHLVLAGQLLADSIAINADFDGSTFIYVPFDPPVLDFDPEVLKEGAFVENNLSVVVPISLDTTAQTEVAFNYCFDVDDAEHPYGEDIEVEVNYGGQPLYYVILSVE